MTKHPYIWSLLLLHLLQFIEISAQCQVTLLFNRQQMKISFYYQFRIQFVYRININLSLMSSNCFMCDILSWSYHIGYITMYWIVSNLPVIYTCAPTTIACYTTTAQTPSMPTPPMPTLSYDQRRPHIPLQGRTCIITIYIIVLIIVVMYWSPPRSLDRIGDLVVARHIESDMPHYMNLIMYQSGF